MANSDGKITIDIEVDGGNARRELNGIEDGLRNTSRQGSEAEKQLRDLGSSISRAFKVAGAAIAALGIGQAVSAVGDFIEANRELLGDLARLDTNAQQAGVGIESAREELVRLQAISGEADSSVEAVSQLLASGFEGDNLTEALDNVAGAAIRFSDTLNVEGISDGLQETLATGSAVGQFGELLERSGVDLKQFDAGLSEASTSAEQQTYVLQQLAQLGLTDTLEAYKETNPEVYAFQEAQARSEQASAGLAQALLPIQTYITNFRTSLVEGITTLLQFDGGISGIITAFQTRIPELLNIAVSWISQLATRYIEFYPTLLQIGTNLLSNIITGIFTFLPTLVQSAASLIMQWVQAIVANLPSILEAGGRILNSIVSGITTAIPQILPVVGNLIRFLVTSLVQNLPTIVQQGVQIIVSLVNGIISAIPGLVAAAAQLIAQLVVFILANLPQILTAGGQIILELIKGFGQVYSNVGSAAKEVANRVIDAFTNINWGDVGKNVIQGIANGITGGVKFALNAAKDAADSVLGKFKSLFDINSPSRVFRDQIGRELMRGVDVGLQRYQSIPIDGIGQVVGNIEARFNELELGDTLIPQASNTSNIINYNARSSASLTELELLLRRQSFLNT